MLHLVEVAGFDGVVPFWMEGVSFDGEAIHFGIGDFNALLVKAIVKCAFYLQSSVRRRRSDQLYDCHSAG